LFAGAADDISGIVLEKKRGDYKKPKASQLKALGQATTTAPGMPDPDNGDKIVGKSGNEKQISKYERKFRLDRRNVSHRKVLENIETKAEDYISAYNRGSIRREFPGEYMNKTVRKIFEDAAKRVPSAQKARKLLTEIMFLK